MHTSEFEEPNTDSVKSKLDQLHDIPLKFKHKQIKGHFQKRKSQTYYNGQGKQVQSDSSSSLDSSEIRMTEFDISEENKKSNILCQYKESFFNEKIKTFNEMKSRKVWGGRISSIKPMKEDSSIKLVKSPSTNRQQSPISESNPLSHIKRMKDLTDQSCNQQKANSPMLFYTSSAQQSINNYLLSNNTSSHLISANNRSQIISQQNSQYTIDVPCNESIAQQSTYKINEKDIQIQIIEAIFNKNVQQLTKIAILLQKEYRTDILNLLDQNGNSPLMLAIKLSYQQNQFDTIRLLLSNGADPSIKDSAGWSPIEETVAQMDIITTSLLFDYLVNKKIFEIQQERRNIDQELFKIDDFYLEMKWEFNSSLIPFLSKFAPNDVFKIYKRSITCFIKGTSLRLDSTFAGTKSYKTKRREMSVIYNPMKGAVQKKENNSNCRFVVMVNRSKKIFYYPIEEIDPEEKKQILLDLLNCESVNGNMKVIGCQLDKSKNIFGNFIHQKIHNWNCQKYEFKVQTQEQFNKKSQHQLFVSLDQYLNQTLDLNPTSARFNVDSYAQQFIADSLLSPMHQSQQQPSTVKLETLNDKNQKQSSKSCQLYICKDFPLNFTQFLPIINMLAKGNEFLHSLQMILNNSNVKELLTSRGFPVRVEIPINFTIDAVVTFQAYRKIDIEDQQITKLFQIPEGFELIQRKEATKVMKREKKRLVLANLFL